MNKTTAPLDDADVMSFHTDDNKSAGPRRDTNFYDEGDSEHKEGEEGGEVGEIGQMEEKGNEAGQTQRRDNAFSKQPLSARYSSFMIKDHSVYVPRRNSQFICKNNKKSIIDLINDNQTLKNKKQLKSKSMAEQPVFALRMIKIHGIIHDKWSITWVRFHKLITQTHICQQIYQIGFRWNRTNQASAPLIFSPEFDIGNDPNLQRNCKYCMGENWRSQNPRCSFGLKLSRRLGLPKLLKQFLTKKSRIASVRIASLIAKITVYLKKMNLRYNSVCSWASAQMKTNIYLQICVLKNLKCQYSVN